MFYKIFIIYSNYKKSEYENFLCLKDMSDLRVKEGDVCDFEFFPICKEWQGKWFTELRISKISVVNRQQEQIPSQDPIDLVPEETDDLPF